MNRRHFVSTTTASIGAAASIGAFVAAALLQGHIVSGEACARGQACTATQVAAGGYLGMGAGLDIGVGLGIGVGEAAAQPRMVVVDLMAIHGVQGPPPGVIDPRLAGVPELRQPPLSSYNTYRLLDLQGLSVALDTPAQHRLPNGRTLQITVRAAANGQYTVTAAISRPEGGDFLKQLEITTPSGKRFFVAGQSYQGGTLMLALSVR